MFDAYVQVDGISGEAADDGHKDWIGVLSYKLGVSQPTQGAVSHGGGRTAGRANGEALEITKMIDKSSPGLHLACCDGTHIAKVTLDICEHSAGKKHKFASVLLNDVVISKISTDGRNSESTNRPTETVCFAYTSITWEYTPIDKTGKAGAATKQGWDFEANKKK